MKVRAAVLEEFGRPLAVRTVDLAEPKAGEALVRLAACGVCHTDLYTASGADPAATRRACSGTRVPASSRLSARTSATSDRAIM
jgi:S-(hydroxymethyl)glutathione dehydrogenase/alcohol dehydrogenase